MGSLEVEVVVAEEEVQLGYHHLPAARPTALLDSYPHALYLHLTPAS